MTVTTSQGLAQTRESWHRVAEHLLAAGQFAAAGTIRLRPSPGGFRTTVGIDGRQLAVVGDQLTVLDGALHRSTRLTTLGDLATFVGLAAGLRGSYSPATSDDPDTPLVVEPEAATLLATWFGLGDAALSTFAEELGRPQEPVLWPEHLDLGITVDGVNYGCSPGDDAVAEPYLYVGPHAGPPAAGGFWNAPFGAAVTRERVHSVRDGVDFFQRGRALTERNEQ